eukprot:16232926-Heterocapsa_arctica.AAC.1
MLPGGCAHWPQEEYRTRPVFDRESDKQKRLAQKPLTTFQHLFGEGFPQKPSIASRAGKNPRLGT